MSDLKSTAPFEVELAEVRLTEHVAVCGISSADKFKKNEKGNGLALTYCGAFVLFERDGETSEAVSFALVKGMRSLKDSHDVEGRRAELAAERQAKELAEKLAKEEREKAAKEKYLADKKAAMDAKLANPNFANAVAIRIEELDGEDVSAPIPTPVESKGLIAEMAMERGVLGDEEKRSMEAAVSRANRGRRR